MNSIKFKFNSAPTTTKQMASNSNDSQDTTLTFVMKPEPVPSQPPKLLPQIRDFLMQNDLDRVITIRDDFKMSWTANSSNLKDIPKVVNNLVEFLNRQGHSECTGAYIPDCVVEWCRHDTCLNAGKWERMEQMDVNLNKLMSELKAKGHTCVTLGQRFPPSVSWCKSEQCLNLGS